MPLKADQTPGGTTGLWEVVRRLQRDVQELRPAAGLRAATGNALSLRGQPLTAAAPAAGQVLAYAAGAWGPATPSSLESTHVAGLHADGVTDDGPVIQATLDTLGVTGAHSWEVVVEGAAGAVVYIGTTVQVRASNGTLRFGSPVLFGPTGRVRIWGELEETPATGKPGLTADAPEGTSTISVTDVTPFSVGDYIAIRGQTDAGGTSFQRMYNVVTGISGAVLTLADPLDSDYLVSYPLSAWPGDKTYVTRVTGSLMSAAPARGDRTATVYSTASFTVGDVVQVIDDSLTTDSTGASQAQNYIHREIAEVKEIVSPTVVRLSHPLHHAYVTAANARVVKVSPVRNSRIENAAVTYAAQSTVNAAFEIHLGVNCSLSNCTVSGGTYSWFAQAFRTSDSYHCLVDHCRATSPVDTSAGRGYGATLYGATYCTVRDCAFVSCRHSVLFYNGSAGNVVTGCHSEDTCISDYDLHGAESVDNLVTGCVAVGGDSVPTDQPGGVRKAVCKAGNPSHTQGDHHNTFSNILAVNYPGSLLDIVPTSSNTILRDSRMVGGSTGITLVAGSNTALVTPDTRVVNCDFEDVATLTNIVGGASSIVDGLLIDRCRFYRATTGISITQATRVHVRNCAFIDPAQPAGTYAVTGASAPGITVKGNDFSGCYRGVKLTSCTSARVTGNTMHDLADTTVLEDAGGNAGMLFARNDLFGFAPFLRISGTGPSASGKVSLESEQYTDSSPSDYGWLEWNFPPKLLASGTGTIAAAGSVYVLKVEPRSGRPVSSIVLNVTVAGAGLTAGQNFVALFDDTGARLAISADQSTAFASTGLKAISLGSSIALMSGRAYYAAVLTNGTTPPTLTRQAATSPGNLGLGNAAQWYSVNGTAQTAMPSSLTLASNTGTGSIGFWVALS